MCHIARVPATVDVAVIGAGVVGAACAWHATRAGLRVSVVDRGPVAGGTTGAGEGNILVSDKPAGPELELAQLSRRLWAEMAAAVRGFEYHAKGGLVVAASEPTRTGLEETAVGQRAAGVEAVAVAADELPGYEPYLARDLAGGIYYPQDAQVQPMLAAARLLADTRAAGAEVRTSTEVTGLLRAGERVIGIQTSAGPIYAGAVVNAAGTWGAEIAAMAGVEVPVLPRRGFVMVTEPLPAVVRHKVYAAEYVSDVASDDAGLQTSPVIEGTESGPVLIGSSRERVGFDRTMSVPILRLLAEQAVRLFPALAGVKVIRAYRGFRPYCPDHLPVIGPDPRAPGLWHACGHEGAGVCLAAATGHVIAATLTGRRAGVDLSPFRPERFG
ncbi:NAD(P)/FAD-dependent oxidoreductase [Phytoactinopolyspora mesophila]|uniref:FAD-dependent oxidoreductase n=1 Tax=Phytoactinopolyspora mesophila TaxID=2650750 RepID=A0A7K3M2N6_9ACTN|nr:FAD-binding oxidoreductase [Phytoactinopolyspora mesophila]NDL57554.1 FAD-dependent oxidoreductase [Phytoactinopolyspora mesophila]